MRLRLPADSKPNSHSTTSTRMHPKSNPYRAYDLAATTSVSIQLQVPKNAFTIASDTLLKLFSTHFFGFLAIFLQAADPQQINAGHCRIPTSCSLGALLQESKHSIPRADFSHVSQVCLLPVSLLYALFMCRKRWARNLSSCR
jgi:hypothetical protein